MMYSVNSAEYFLLHFFQKEKYKNCAVELFCCLMYNCANVYGFPAILYRYFLYSHMRDHKMKIWIYFEDKYCAISLQQPPM